MANMPNVNNRMIGLRPPIELCRKVERKYLRDDDRGNSVAYIRALEDATRDVRLTTKDYSEIAAEARRNAQRRKAARNG